MSVCRRRGHLVLAHAAGYLRVMWACGLFFFIAGGASCAVNQVWISSVISSLGSPLRERGSSRRM